MKIIQLADKQRYPRMTTSELRETFLIDDLFHPGRIDAVYVDLDRTIIGSAVPLAEPLALGADPELRASYFTERRELGVLNIGGDGSVRVNDREFPLGNLDCLYVGRGNEKVSFTSKSASKPAEFYLLSYPAHAVHPTTFVESSKVAPVLLGAPETCNQRGITKLIHLEGVKSCQLVMGFTQLASGSAWNTMPPHTHMRRSEVYLYFNLQAEDRVLHLMGPADEIRVIVAKNKQAVISPGWSVHAGVGTRNYTFCWGMGGENQVYTDMDALKISDLV
jgi:4-deoxy-L-threo-5-hexosulose-uronate ketol-isomerase